MSKTSKGWGGSLQNSNSDVVLEIEKLADSKGRDRGAIPVGLRRSYGDSAINSGGLEVLSSNYKKIDLDSQTGKLRVGSGNSIKDVSQFCIRNQWYLPVVPGTGNVTIGGAFASDIHGKSHHTSGNFSEHVTSVKVMNAELKESEYSASGPESEKFWATAGGMGLTGLITELEIQLIPIETNFIKTKNYKVNNLQEMLKMLELLNKTNLYTVAWIDLSGDFSGRGIVSIGNHATRSQLPRQKKQSSAKNNKFTLETPNIFKKGVINPFTVKIFNELWFRKPIKDGMVEIANFMHPLDGIEKWNRLYGKNGFIQYQFVIPYEHQEFLKEVLKRLRQNGIASPMGVLKSFGREGRGMLSFPIPGWTLAIDIPMNSRKASSLLKTLDIEILNMGGRVYLTKDSRIDSHTIEKMYPRLEEWRKVKKAMDPDKFWQSDQSRRLRLC